MMAKIQYRVVNIHHPWDEKLASKGITAWCLVREIVQADAEHRVLDFKPIALFNLDSDAETFQRWLCDGGQVEPHPDWKELVKLQKAKS